MFNGWNLGGFQFRHQTGERGIAIFENFGSEKTKVKTSREGGISLLLPSSFRTLPPPSPSPPLPLCRRMNGLVIPTYVFLSLRVG